MIVKTKFCRKCGEVKSLDEFSRDKTHRDGRYSLCKKCKNAYKKKLKAQNPKRYLALSAACRKRYEILYPERLKVQQEKADKKRRDRDARDPEKIKARQEREAKRIDKTLHPEKYKAQRKAQKRKSNKKHWAKFSAEDREKINAQRRASYANDPKFRAKEKERDKKRWAQRSVAYRKRHDRDPEKYRAMGKAVYARAKAKDPEKVRARSRKAHQKRKADKTKIMLMKAFDIVRSELTDVIDHKEKLEQARAKINARRARKREQEKVYRDKLRERNARKPENIKARQEREAKKKDKALHSEKYLAQAREYSLAYYYKNRENLLAKAKANRAKYPEKYEAYERTYKANKAKNPEKYRAKSRAYHAKNRDKIYARQRARYAKDPEKYRDHKKNRASVRKCFHKRHGGMTKFTHVVAEVLLTINLLKGIEDDKGTK